MRFGLRTILSDDQQQSTNIQLATAFCKIAAEDNAILNLKFGIGTKLLKSSSANARDWCCPLPNAHVKELNKLSQSGTVRWRQRTVPRTSILILVSTLPAWLSAWQEYSPASDRWMESITSVPSSWTWNRPLSTFGNKNVYIPVANQMTITFKTKLLLLAYRLIHFVQFRCFDTQPPVGNRLFLSSSTTLLMSFRHIIRPIISQISVFYINNPNVKKHLKNS